MVFSSLSFLLYFMPSLLIVYFIIPQRFRQARNILLLLFSLLFYGCAGAKFLLLMALSVSVNYAGGLLCSKGGKGAKFSLVITVILNLSLLAYFKYAGFFTEIINSLGSALPLPHITLPIGISFFTFQGLSYAIDTYRDTSCVQKNPLKLALYIALFPQLVAGPIVRYSTVAHEIDNRHETLSECAAGGVRFLIGLGKKMVLANSIASVADAAFSSASPSSSFAWLGIIAYALQIYFDFSAYSDMAIGLGKIFGFHFLENFNYPYMASSVSDFWKRWHISLSSWFRDYVYIPLGGSRCSVPRQILNLLAVWFLTGMWHGASWNFIFWGLWYFVFLVGEKFVWGHILGKSPAPLRHALTLLVILFGWVMFRADNISSALSYAGAMFGANGALGGGEAVYYILEYLPEWVLCIIAVFPLKRWMENRLTVKKESRIADAVLTLGPQLIALACLAVSYIELVNGSFNPFIYFRF